MKNEARTLLLSMIDPKTAALADTTPEAAVDAVIHEAILNQPSIRICLFPGCTREFDMTARMNGWEPARPSWSGDGWHQITRGPSHGSVCPDHVAAVTEHLPQTVELPNQRWATICACGWISQPKRYSPVVRILWEEHLLTATGRLPAPPPVTDPEHRIPLADHTDDTLAELYDRLWDAETFLQETRDNARDCIHAYTTAVPALLGVRIALEGLRERITVDSRDWAADKLDALLYAILVGWNCENTDPSHKHDDIDCAGDQGLWNIARQHGISIDQTMQANNRRWWVANAIKVAKQIEEANQP